MKSLLAFWLLLGGLWLGLAEPASAQRPFRRGYYAPRVYRRPYAPRYYAPRYYHAAPYRPYGGRYYYRPRPVPRAAIRVRI